MKHILNKNIPIPLYYQLKMWLVERIDSGDLKPGDAIPSERELSEQFEISRMTVRQALLELVNEGKLVREKGVGTFVAEPKIRQGLLKLTSFSEDMESRGMKPGARVIDLSVKKATAVIQNKLEIAPSESVLTLKRLRLADEKPMAIEMAHLPLSRFPGLTRFDFNDGSLYHYLKTHYGVEIAHAVQTIEVAMPSSSDQELLNMPSNVPVLLTERVTMDGNRIPVEFATSIYRGDRYKLYAELER